MPWRLRRDAAPADITAALPTAPGERVLASSQERGGGWHIATSHALYVADGAGQHRIPWEHVDRAAWDSDAERLVVVEVADFGEPQPRHELSVPEPGRLLEVVRERVTASVLMTRHVPVAGSRGLKVVARRPPAGGGEVQWSFWLDDGLEPSDPLVREAAQMGLAEARAELRA
jgi:hypothetical protein